MARADKSRTAVADKDEAKVAGAVVDKVADGSAGNGRIAATDADFLAAKLHRAYEENIELRRLVVQLRSELVSRQNELDDLRIQNARGETESLRVGYKLHYDKVITKDAQTGEVYWSELPSQQQ